MGEIKLRAGYLMLKNRKEIKREMLFIKLMLAGIVFCLAGGMSFLLSGKLLLFLLSLAGGILLSFFYFSGRLYLAGKLYSLSGEMSEEPSWLIRFSSVLRYAVFVLREASVKFLWLNFFLLPSRFAGLIILRTLMLTGNIQRIMLFALLAAFVLLSLGGWCFYFYTSGRYFLGELLFVRCPKQKPSEILKSSALLTAGSLPGVMLFRIRNLFSRGGAYGRMRSALFSSDLFSDRKFYKNYGLKKPFTFPEPF
jgi:hypothetical protein